MNTKKRQGDVLFVKMKKSDVGLNDNNVGERKESLTVALGEVTGHHHTVFGTDEASVVDLTAYEESDKQMNQNDLAMMMFQIENGSGIVRHDEHDPTLLEETAEDEVWVRTIQREYDPTAKAMSRVRD